MSDPDPKEKTVEVDWQKELFSEEVYEEAPFFTHLDLTRMLSNLSTVQRQEEME